MTENWREIFRKVIEADLSANFAGNGQEMLYTPWVDVVAASVVEAIQDPLQRFRVEALYQGAIIGAEDARERVREAFEDGYTDPEDIIRLSGPPQRRKRHE